MADSLAARVQEILGSVLGLAPEALSESGSQAEIIQWDSLAHLNLILALQDEFGVSFSEAEMLGMTSAAAIESVLRRRGIVG